MPIQRYHYLFLIAKKHVFESKFHCFLQRVWIKPESIWDCGIVYSPHTVKRQKIFDIYRRNPLHSRGVSSCKVQDYMPYRAYEFEKIYGRRKCDCPNVAAKGCQFRKSRGGQFQCSSLRLLYGIRTTI